MNLCFVKRVSSPVLAAVCLFLLQTGGVAQPVYLSADSLPEGGWRKGAHAVLRLNQARLEVQPGGKSTLEVRRITTILDPLGDAEARVNVGYSKTEKIVGLTIKVYNKFGKSIYSSDGKNDIGDYGLYDGVSLATDAREKRWFQKSADYPYTVEVVYSQVYQNIFFLQAWLMGPEYDLPLQRSSFELSSAIPLRIKGYGPCAGSLPMGDSWVTAGQWTLGQQPALEKIPLGLPSHYRYTLLRFGAESFSVDDAPGSFRDWQSMGKFYATLNQSLDLMPPAEQATVRALTDTCTSDLSRVRVLYRWLQQTTRYVSVQLGVGGFRTFDARYVAQNGYGDCKALVNYLQAALKVVQIPSYPALVYAGNVPDIDCGFPSQQFNHVILCVPMSKDSLWVECTAEALPAGYPGDFTAGRHVLLIAPEGGKLCQTPADLPENHAVVQHFTVSISPVAASLAELNATLAGDAAAEGEMVRLMAPAKEVEEWKLRRVSRQSVTILQDTWKFDISSIKPTGIYSARIEVPNIVTAAGSRRLINTGYFAPDWPVRAASFLTSQPIYLPETVNRTDSVVIQLPPGWLPETAPKAISLECAAGRYSATFQALPNGQLLAVKHYLLLKGSYPDMETDHQVRTFLLAVAKADKAVWICQTTP